MNEEARHLKGIQSFVVRGGRMSDRQKEALERVGRFRPDLQSLHSRPVILDIGFGMADTLFEMAERSPEYHFIGAEVHPPALARAVLKLESHPLPNVSLVFGDVNLFLEELRIKGFKLEKIQLFFPDPWPKKRHHKRRLIQTSWVLGLVEVLRPRGELHFATDWTPYAEHAKACFEACPNLSSKEHSRLPRTGTKFEQKGLGRNREITDLIYELKE